MNTRAARVLVAWGCLMVGNACAQQAESCVDVSVNQHAVLAYDCLSRQLSGDGRKPAGPPPPMLDAVTREPSNRQAGQYNAAALEHRMGSNLGRSVLPQRPAPTYTPLMPRGRSVDIEETRMAPFMTFRFHPALRRRTSHEVSMTTVQSFSSVKV